MQSVALENLLYRQIEQIGNLEGERQRGVIAPRLNSIHALPRNVQPGGQILLAPVTLCAQDFQPVFHQTFPQVPIVMRLYTAPTPRPTNQKNAAPKPAFPFGSTS